MSTAETHKVTPQPILQERMNSARQKDMRPGFMTLRWFAVLGVALSLFAAPARAENGPSPQELMDGIGSLMEGKTPDGHIIGKEDAWSKVLALREELGNCGEQAVPEIEARIKAEKDPQTRSVFLYALGKIPGERVDKILLGYFCFDRSMASTAGMQLTWRTEHNGPFRFVVPDEQIDAMLEMVRKRPVFEIDHVLRVLGMCSLNAPGPIGETMIARFAVEVKRPAPDGGAVGGAYVSPRVYMLNAFLLAFGYMKERMVAPLRAAHEKAWEESDEELVKWLSMALGDCGDPSVAGYLEEMLMNEQDRYVRCAAIRPYASSAGQKAIPLLLKLLEDKTKTEYQMFCEEAKYIIRGVSHDTLVDLVRRITGNSVDSWEETLKVARELAAQQGETVEGKGTMVSP